MTEEGDKEGQGGCFGFSHGVQGKACRRPLGGAVLQPREGAGLSVDLGVWTPGKYLSYRAGEGRREEGRERRAEARF